MAYHGIPRVVAVAILLAVVASVAAARTWTSRDGKFTTDAELIDFKDGQVRLRKSDGSEVSVPLAKFSDADQEFVRNQYLTVPGDEKKDGKEAGAGEGSEVREWTSRDGKFKTRAKFVESVGGKIRLEREDGKTIDVPLAQLSPEDRAWVGSHAGGHDEGERGGDSRDGTETEGDEAESIGRLDANSVEMKLVELKVGKGARKKPDALTRHVLETTSPQLFFVQGGQPKNVHEDRFNKLVTKDREYEYAKPFRAVAMIGGEQYPFALDAVGKSPKGFNRLYIDLNRNGDMTDESPIATKDVEGNAAQGRTTSQSTFDRIKVPIERDGSKVDLTFGMFASCVETSRTSQTVVQLRSLSYREGEIQHGGKKIRLLLLDCNSNGWFDDRVSFRNTPSNLQIGYGDLLLINPRFRGSRAVVSTSQDTVFVNKTVCLDGAFYSLDVSPTGDRVKLEPTELVLGHVSNNSPVYRATVCCDDHGVMEIAGTKGEKIGLPVGKWQVARYTLGVSGGEATMVTASFAGKASEFEVEADATTELPFGPPFRGLVTGRRLDAGRVGLSLALVGQGGERCNDFVVNGKRPPAPKFEVRDQDGKVVYSGKFEYG